MISHVLDAAIYQQRLLIHQRLRLKGGGYQQRVCGGVGAYHQVLVAMGVFLTNADSEEGVGSVEGARGQLPPMLGGGVGGGGDDAVLITNVGGGEWRGLLPMLVGGWGLTLLDLWVNFSPSRLEVGGHPHQKR